MTIKSSTEAVEEYIEDLVKTADSYKASIEHLREQVYLKELAARLLKEWLDKNG